jgi:hypothetical protein
MPQAVPCSSLLKGDRREIVLKLRNMIVITKIQQQDDKNKVLKPSPSSGLAEMVTGRVLRKKQLSD